MIEQLLNHIRRHQLCKTTDKILLAVSGGVDSMVMLYLFHKAGFSIAVAHCNFQLRAADSDRDEALVRETCAAHGIPFFAKRFDTAATALDMKESIQVTARILRYEFFRQLAEVEGFAAIATAHHRDDNVETVLLNLTRGTGIDGLTGIPLKNDNIIRPLLFAGKEEIRAFAVENNIKWRDDESNNSDDYSRNYLRQHVIPKLKELNPGFDNTFSETVERIRGMHDVAQQSLASLLDHYVSKDGGRIFIHQDIALASRFPEVVLWELLKGYGFNYDQCKLLVKEHQSGRIFYSHRYQIVVDRQRFILEEIQERSAAQVRIGEGQSVAAMDGWQIDIGIKSIKGLNMKDGNAHTAHFDAGKVVFPLTWRAWAPGDSLVPFGMQNRKKISDLLIDLRVPLGEKQRVTVIQSGADIIWVVGYRMHENYKIDRNTRTALVMNARKV